MALTRPRAYQIYDIDYKQATRVVTTTNITLAGGAPNTVDSISLALNDRVLVTGQSAAAQNGIYYVTILGTGSNGTWTRSIDTDATGELLAGTIVMVTEGAVYQDTQWKLTTNDPITIGVTALTFVQNYSTSSISAGTSNVVVASNSSVTISSAGTANVVKVDATNVSVTANIVPTANVTYSLGTSTTRFKDIYLANNSIYLGNLTLAGDDTQLTVNGANVVTSTNGVISTAGNITGGNILTNGLISAAGNITGSFFFGNGSQLTGIATGTPNSIVNGTSNVVVASSANVTVAVTGNNVATFTATGLLVTGIASATGNITGGNILTGGLISATGNITSAANITGGNLLATTTVSAASYIGSVVSVTANVTAGNILSSGLISVTGNITAAGNISGNYFAGNGRFLTGITGGSGVAFTSQANTPPAAPNNGDFWYNTYTDVKYQYINDGDSSQWVDQSFPTSYTTLSASGNITAGNLLTGGLTSSTGNITSAANISGGNILTGGLISATGNITSGNLNVSGNIVDTGALTIITGSNGNIALAPNGTGIVTASGNVSAVGNVTGGNILTGGLISATGNITGGNLISSGTITTAGNIVTTAANATANIGSATTYFNTVHAKATSAQYADVAEKYLADSPYAPGTVVCFGGAQEVTISNQSHSTSVAGVVSTNPAYIMNAGAVGNTVVEVALLGRVPCMVVGPVVKGDRLVTSEVPGVARVLKAELYQPGCIIGKALENNSNFNVKTVEVVVGRI